MIKCHNIVDDKRNCFRQVQQFYVEVDNSGRGDGQSSVSLLWVEARCGEGAYCWLLCYQIMPDRLCHRGRSWCSACAVAMPNCSADKGLKVIAIRGVSKTPPGWSLLVGALLVSVTQLLWNDMLVYTRNLNLAVNEFRQLLKTVVFRLFLVWSPHTPL